MAFLSFDYETIKLPAGNCRQPRTGKNRNNMFPSTPQKTSVRLKIAYSLGQRMLLLCLALLLGMHLCIAIARTAPDMPGIRFAELPVQAQRTVQLIRQGGPFPYPKDGTVFGNYEGVLPKQKRGYYHEFTVKTPGRRGRGARRIVVGGDWQTSRELYYTDNHYASFRRIIE